RFVERNGTARNARREVLAGHELEHEKAQAFRLLEAVDGTDTGMIQRGQEARFAFEPRQAVRVVGKYFRKNLERNVAAKPGIAGTVHLAHSARADLFADFVVAELLWNHGAPGV